MPEGVAHSKTRQPSGIAFWIHVTPGAKSRAIGGSYGDALRVAVSPPAARGRANAACLALLAEEFGVRKTEIKLNPAARGRRKRVEIRGDPLQLGERLHALAQTPRVG